MSIIKTKYVDILFSACFLVGVAGTAIATVLQTWTDYSYFENRALNSAPILTWDTFWDGSYFTEWESALVDHAVGREEILRITTLADLNVIHRPVVNQVVPTNGKLLYQFNYEIVDQEELMKQAMSQSVVQAKLQAMVESYGGYMLYVAVPGQYTYFQDEMPSFLNSRAAYTRAEMDAITRAFNQMDVSFLDVGPIFNSMGHPEEFYSATDHHFTYAGAYQTYLLIMNRLTEEFDSDLSVLTGDLINFETLPNRYVGSRLRMVFGLWPTLEHPQIANFSIQVPFTRTDNGRKVDAEVFAMPNTENEDVLYDIYMGGMLGTLYWILNGLNCHQC